MTELTKNERRLAAALIGLFGSAIAFPRAAFVAASVALLDGPTWAWFGAGMIVQTIISERWSARQMEKEALR